MSQPYGVFDRLQLEALEHYVSGRVVHDIGCGPLFPHASLLRRCGAELVIGVDKEPLQRKLEAWEKYHHTSLAMRTPVAMDVAFISWPLNGPMKGRQKVLYQAEVIAYLGKNTEGSVCGDAEMFRAFLRRELLAYVPDSRNTLIIVGATLSAPREPTYEEHCGLDQDGEIYPFKKEKSFYASPA